MPATFAYRPILQTGPDTTRFRLVSKEGVSIDRFDGREILKVSLEALTLLAKEAAHDASYFLRPAHLEQVAAILGDPEASENDRFVAMALLRNAEISAHGVLPFCQDTGTATVMAKKGQQVWTGGGDEAAIAHGIFKTYTEENLRYSQTVPASMYEEKNSGTNLPAQIDLMAADGTEYKFLFVLKGGGSANKSFLYQETKALLNPASLEKFMIEKMKSLGTSACPPYHLVFVIGGTSAEACMKTVKLATAKYLDELPTRGGDGALAFRDVELETKMLQAAQQIGIGAQFGGKYFALDVRIIRLPRHGASCPVGVGVSCSADRNIKAKIDRDGVWIEQLETNPGRFIPEQQRQTGTNGAVAINLDQPMRAILAELDKHPVRTRLALSGTLVVARDIAHAKLKARLHQESSRVLRGTGQDAEGHGERFIWPHHGGPHGRLRRSLPIAGRLHGDDGKGQSRPAREGRLQKIRRFLSRLARRTRGVARPGAHPES
jgi:fumarate hydratase class I